MAGLFFPRCLRPRSDGTSATMVPGVGTRADREGDSTIRKHAPIRLKSSVARNYCPKLYVSPCWLRRFERAILCYHENRTSPPRPPALSPHDGSFVRATLQSDEHVTRYRLDRKRFVENSSVLLIELCAKRYYRTSALVISKAYNFIPTFIFWSSKMKRKRHVKLILYTVI